MKRKFITPIALAIAAIAMIFYGCEKKDNAAPEIVLQGANPFNIPINVAYVDPGATATDDKDGSVTITTDISSTNPDTSTVSTYTIHYSATDGAGNTAHASRVVNVVVVRDTYIGRYSVEDSSYSSASTFYADTVIEEPTTYNNLIKFKNFGNMGLNCVATTNASIITMAQQVFNGTDTISATDGTMNNKGKSFTFTYFNNSVKHRAIFRKQ